MGAWTISMTTSSSSSECAPKGMPGALSGVAAAAAILGLGGDCRDWACHVVEKKRDILIYMCVFKEYIYSFI